MIKTCQNINCGKEFNTSNSKTKYCSRDCYYKTVLVGRVKSKEEREKLSIANSGKVYKGTTRAENIAKANGQRDFTEEELDLFKASVIKYDYITNIELIINVSNIESSFGRVKKTKKYILRNIMNLTRDRTWGKDTKFFPLSVQKWSYEKMQSLKNDVIILARKDILKKYNLSEKTFYNLRKFYNLVYNKQTGKKIINKNYTQNFTYPERYIYELLTQLGIRFKREIYVNGMRWRIDFICEDMKSIEVQGDYWHGNPKIFKKEDLNEMQIRNIENDKNKKDWLLSNGYTYICIWEDDIKHNSTIIKNQINEYFNFDKLTLNLLKNIKVKSKEYYLENNKLEIKLQKLKKQLLLKKELRLKRQERLQQKELNKTNNKGYTNSSFIQKWKPYYDSFKDNVVDLILHTNLSDMIIIKQIAKMKAKMPKVLNYYEYEGLLQEKTIDMVYSDFHHILGKRTNSVKKSMYSNTNITKTYKFINETFFEKIEAYLSFILEEDVSDSMLYNNYFNESWIIEYKTIIKYMLYLNIIEELSIEKVNIKKYAKESKANTSFKTVYKINSDFKQDYILIKGTDLNTHYKLDVSEQRIKLF